MIHRPLHPVAVEALEVIHQHRLLATSQINRILTPANLRHWTRRLLLELERRGLVDAVAAHPSSSGRSERLWFLTERGADVVLAVPDRTEPRRRVLNPETAASQLQAHTLAVNDAGIAFLDAARRRGHDFGPLSWRHELAHPLEPGRRHSLTLIADALLRYWISTPAGATLHYRFLELDRANLPLDDLVTKLARYGRLHRLWREQRGSADASGLTGSYRAFPRLLVVLDNPGRLNLQQRRRTLLALCRSELGVRRSPSLAISFCLLPDLMACGPFAPIFCRPEDERWVNWLGETDPGLEGEGGMS
jgi:hypothetical protein